MRDFTHEGFNTPGIMWFHLITLRIHLYCAINDFYTDKSFYWHQIDAPLHISLKPSRW